MQSLPENKEEGTLPISLSWYYLYTKTKDDSSKTENYRPKFLLNIDAKIPPPKKTSKLSLELYKKNYTLWPHGIYYARLGQYFKMNQCNLPYQQKEKKTQMIVSINTG